MGCNIEDTFGTYTSLDEAKMECEQHQNCGKVCDKFCLGNLLTLCKRGADETTTDDTCLYEHVRDDYGYACTDAATDCSVDDSCTGDVCTVPVVAPCCTTWTDACYTTS